MPSQGKIAPERRDEMQAAVDPHPLRTEAGGEPAMETQPTFAVSSTPSKRTARVQGSALKDEANWIKQTPTGWSLIRLRQ